MADTLNIEFDPTYRLAICRPAGVFGPEQAAQLLYFLLALEDSNPGPFKRLLDLTGVTEIRLSTPEIFGFAKMRQQATASLPPLRTAVIAADQTTEEMALTYATIMEDSNIQVAIFHDTKSAADWLSVPEAAIHSKVAHQT
jgi:hypothetical protein